MKLRYHIILFTGLLLLGSLLAAKPGQAVTISQLIVEINAHPGETVQQLIQLYDDALTGVTVYPSVSNFTEDPNREGSALVLTDPADLKPDRDWVKYDVEQLTLPAEGTLVDFPYRLEIPEDAEPGTHLLSIVFQTRPQESEKSEGSVIYISANVVTNIFLKVTGATIDKIDAEFKTGIYTNKSRAISPNQRNQYFQPKTFFLKTPVDFQLIVSNQGNTHQKPDGNVRIINDFLGGPPEKLLINQESKIILPDNDRTYEVPSFGQGFMFGKYRAKLTLLYGSPLRTVEKEIVFWIMPVVEISIALGSLILIIIIIIIIRKAGKRRRQKHEAEQEKKQESKDKEREERLRKVIMEELQQKKNPKRKKPNLKKSKNLISKEQNSDKQKGEK
ncbi:hypothetical protein IID19_00985 [Patescibacteria group bacterium]|nr:hypothetical protein [Patescibacteria group bacterium]